MAAYGHLLPQGEKEEGCDRRHRSTPANCSQFRLLRQDCRFARRANLPRIGVLDRNPKSAAHLDRPVPSEGRLAIVTNAGRDAVDVDALKDEWR